MTENIESNPYADHGGGPGPERAGDNPYFGRKTPDAVPDLDASAPTLVSADAQRVNRKALMFLAGIVGLVLLMAFLVFRGATARDDSAARPKQERVVIPELPVSAARTPAEATPAEPIGVRPYETAALEPELPPLPPEPPASRGYGPDYAERAPAVPLPPSLLERRIGGVAEPRGTPDPYAQAMQAHPGMPPGAEAPAAPARSRATGAQFLQHPDALLVRGTYLRCILETRIVTDIPGYTSCVLTESVYSINGRNLLLPKGSKILGRYETEPNGPRVAVIWDRITTPNGIDVNMASPGIDNLGGAGHPGHYDAHWPSRMASALLISLVSDAFKYAGARNGPRTVTVTSGLITETPYESNTARSVQRLADQALEQGSRRPPTVTINQGTMVNVYVARDVDFSGVLARR